MTDPDPVAQFKTAEKVLGNIRDLEQSLKEQQQGDADSEILSGAAIATIERVLDRAAEVLPDDPAVDDLRHLITPDRVVEGEPLMVADALRQVAVLSGAVGRRFEELRYEQPGATRRRRAT